MSSSRSASLAAASMFLLAACESTIDRGRMVSELAARPLFDVSSAVAETKPDLALPCVLAVAPPRTHRRQELAWEGTSETASGHRSWTAEERASIESWEPELARAGLVSEVVVMPMLTTVSGSDATGPDLSALCAAALRHHADVVLVVSEVEDASNWLNPWSILDLTIVGAWFAPGHDVEVVSIFEGALIEARTGYLYASGQGEGRVHARRAWAYVDDPDLAAEARTKALSELQKNLYRNAHGRTDGGAR